MRAFGSLLAAAKQKSVLELSGLRTVPENSTVFSAIQPSGVFHLGNYLGAVRSWVDIAETATDSTNLIYAVADLHALTVPKDPKQLSQWRNQAIASILATGIDPERCTVYHQSHVPEHTQLNWVLSTITSMGYLNRMVQWKSKASLKESSSIESLDENGLSKLQMGLFAYPVLMAADIMIHKANYVPVGEDQSQHLELTRQITTTFNSNFGNNANIFPVPSTLFAPYRKVASLRDTSKKMSKSDSDKNSCLYITDDAATISRKIRKSVTDSIQGPITYDPGNRPGVANLLMIVSGLLKTDPESLLQNELAHVKDHKQFKDSTAEIIVDALAPVREKYTQLMEDPDYLQKVTSLGTEKARHSAARTIDEVYRAVGLS